MLSTVHLILAISTLLLVLYSDEQAFKWLLGKLEVMNANRVLILHRLVTFALASLIIVGGFLYVRAPEAYLSYPVFVLKMSSVLALILNSYAIEQLSTVATTRPFASLSHSERIPLFMAGGISGAAWATAFVCGLILA